MEKNFLKLHSNLMMKLIKKYKIIFKNVHKFKCYL